MCYRGKCLHCIPVKPACLVIAILYAIFNGLLVVGCIYVWARILIEAGSSEVPSPNTGFLIMEEVPSSTVVSVICGKNEEYYDCLGQFKPRRCSEIGYPLNYTQKCTPGCVCKDRYVRADNGTCIPIPDCPSCGGDKNAEQNCGVNCFPTCSNYNIKPPTECALYCLEDCKCREGFVYDDNVQACIKPEDCVICEKNEEYYDCSGKFKPLRCSEIGYPLKYTQNCMPGCVCKGSNVRADNGTCIPIPDCPSCGGDKNATYGCGSPCRRTCSNYNERQLLCEHSCTSDCICKNGFVYDENVQACVKPEDCVSVICAKDEKYYGCSGECKPRRCSEIGFTIYCNKNCTPGCVCKGSYVREDNGTCIPRSDCPSCGGDKNAKYGFNGLCPRTCFNYNPLQCNYTGDCICKEGFIYDDSVQACVKPEECGTGEKRVKRYVPEPEDSTYDRSSGWNGPSSYFVVPLVALLNFIFSTLLCNGICNLRPKHVKAFYWYGVVLTVVMVVYALVQLCLSGVLAAVVWLIICVIHTLFLVLVNQTHKVVEDSVNNGKSRYQSSDNLD